MPYHGDPLEITHFATYWKATSTLNSDPNGLITGSSLSGDYVQLFVQLTKDCVPVLCPEFTITHHGIDMPICRLSFGQFKTIGVERSPNSFRDSSLLRSLEEMTANDIESAHRLLATSFLSLREVLLHLPTSIHINLCVLYPSAAEEEKLDLEPVVDINGFVDAILTEVFNHARASKEKNQDFLRSIVFSSYSPSTCIALNWKQPNCGYLVGRFVYLTDHSG